MDAVFRSKVSESLVEVKKILDVTRKPSFAPDVQHQYEDKYLLAEMLVNVGVAAQMNCLEALGLKGEDTAKLLEWAASRSVTLRFATEEKCEFVKKVERKEDSKTEHVTKTKVLGFTATSSSKVVTTITEWIWRISASFELFAFQGTDASSKIVLSNKASTVEVKTSTEHSPYPSVGGINAFDLNLTWLLQQINPSTRQLRFRIDRDADSCRTPRRNRDVDGAFSFFSSVSSWRSSVDQYLDLLFQKQQPAPPNASINASGLFVPVLPLFEENQPSVTSSSSSSSPPSASSSTSTPAGRQVQLPEPGSPLLMSLRDTNAFLEHQVQLLEAKRAELAKVYAPETALANPFSAFVRVVCMHISDIHRAVVSGVQLIETMLFNQLVAAIGKVITPVDFSGYMRFHNRKLFRVEYEPKPFCYAVRRPDHYPEGTVSIEGQLDDGSIPQPILTSVRAVEPVHAMRFAIDAATNVTFHGERYLHSWIDHSFNGSSGLSLSLNARARQFSSFIVLVGKVASATVFEPTGAMILQNKDDLKIPLILETIPTPKEFRDATESLSPEERRVAKA